MKLLALLLQMICLTTLVTCQANNKEERKAGRKAARKEFRGEAPAAQSPALVAQPPEATVVNVSPPPSATNDVLKHLPVIPSSQQPPVTAPQNNPAKPKIGEITPSSNNPPSTSSTDPNVSRPSATTPPDNLQSGPHDTSNGTQAGPSSNLPQIATIDLEAKKEPANTNSTDQPPSSNSSNTPIILILVLVSVSMFLGGVGFWLVITRAKRIKAEKTATLEKYETLKKMQALPDMHKHVDQNYDESFRDLDTISFQIDP